MTGLGMTGLGLRPAAQADLSAIETFLQARAARAMFPLANLRRFGLQGEQAYAPRFWIDATGEAVTGLLCVLQNHTVLPLCPPEATLAHLRGGKLFRLMGPAELCRPVAEALTIDRSRAEVDRDEPHFALDLAQLAIPDGPGHLLPPSAVNRTTLLVWRAAYLRETLGMADGPDLMQEAIRQLDHYIAQGTHRVLVEGETPLAMTGFNASLPDMVQIGGVFTPRALRGQGFARRAVALHLAEARQGGVTRATLCAANASAAQAYTAIGFQRIGDWTMLLLPEAVDV